MAQEAELQLKRWQVWAAVGIMLMALLACGANEPVVEEPTAVPPATVPAVVLEDAEDEVKEDKGTEDDAPPAAVETAVPQEVVVEETAVDAPVAIPANLTGDQREGLASATVFIAMLQEQSGDRYIMGSGSGTLISPDGLILTNAHVASPMSMGMSASDEPDALGIGLVERADQPPVPTYLAEVVAVDGRLDLAVIRITSTLDGSRLGKLDLPYVPLGDSDGIRLGDGVNIFGFPGIGGDTITFTRGSVSGFSSEDVIGDRAWIKTDATIAGGNSGGLATNDLGELIGVPTRASSGTNEQVTDCRVVQDTNGDGRLDDRDNCVPIGGFINALRPIKLAMPLIRAAQTAVAYKSPYDEVLIPTSKMPSGSGGEQFRFATWAEDYTDSGCAVSPVASYGSGEDLLVAIFAFEGLTDGQEVAIYWLLDGEVFSESDLAWDNGRSGDCVALWFQSDTAFPDGEYTVLIYAGDGLPLVGEASTSVGSAVVFDGVSVSGKVTDADTGRGINDAVVIVLKPGIDVEAWLDDPYEEAIYTNAEASRNGEYKLPALLQRGQRYEAIAFAEGYSELLGFLEFDERDSDQQIINLELAR